MLNLKHQIWDDYQAIRKDNPLISNITNFVVMNFTCNALLSIGASPIVTCAVEEVAEVAEKCDAMVINMGTVNAQFVELVRKAVKGVKKSNVPVVFDPVGVGFTKYRSKIATEIIETAKPRIIRGNAGEIIALAGSKDGIKGVDSLVKTEKALDSLSSLSHAYDCTLSASGETDVIVCGDKIAYIGNGSVQARQVTGMGCVASAITAAFSAVNPSGFQSAVGAMSIMGICEEIAYLSSSGPASFSAHFLDAMSHLTEDDFFGRLRLQI